MISALTGSLDKLVSETVRTASSMTELAVGTVSSATDTVASSITAAASSAANEVKSTVSHGVGTVVNEIADRVDSVKGAVSVAVETAQTYAAYTAAGGVIIGLITAPVPTIVGIAIMAAMAEHMDAFKRDVDRGNLDRSNRRRLDKAVKTLSDYGTIPAHAILETPSIRLELDAAHGVITGHINRASRGIFTKAVTKVDVVNLTREELVEWSAGQDDNTKKIVDAYLSFRGRG